jgi:hypothetical protein
MIDGNLKFYVASSLKNKDRVQSLIRVIESETPHTCIYDWTTNIMEDSSDPAERKLALNNELDAIVNADLVIGFPPLARGSHVELGYALAYNTPIIMVGERDLSCLSYDYMGWVKDAVELVNFLKRKL